MQSATDGVSQDTRNEDPQQVETQLQQRDRSTIDQSAYLKSGDVKVPPEQMARIGKNDPNDVANMTSITSRDESKPKSLMMNLDRKKGDNLSDNEHAKFDQGYDSKRKKHTHEDRENIKSPSYQLHKNELVRVKQSDGALSVSTLSNEDYRKRAPSHMKAKYKSGAQTSNVSRVGEARSRKRSQRGSVDPDLSDNNADPAINEDISQSLQTKQTGFNHTINGTENENVLERESQFRVTDNGFQININEGSGALMFHAQNGEDPAFRHIYATNNKHGVLNNAGSQILLPQKPTGFGQFALKHKLSLHGNGISK